MRHEAAPVAWDPVDRGPSPLEGRSGGHTPTHTTRPHHPASMVHARHSLKLGSHPTALAVACALLCLSGCGEVDDAPVSKHQLDDHQRVRPVALEAIAPARDEDKLKSMGNVPIPNEASDWPVDGCEAFVRDLPPDSTYATRGSDETVRVFVLPGTESKTVRISQRFIGSNFNVVGLRVSVFQEETVFIQFMEKGKAVLSSNAVTINGGREPQVILFPLPQSRLHAMPFDQLSVRIDGRGGIFVIHDVEFYSRPISSWLPDPEEAPELVAVGSDLRRGVGLSSFRGVRGEFVAPENGGFLSFSLGVPESLRYPSGTQARPSVRVEIESATGGRIERRFNLRETAQNARWQHVRVPLNNFSKERIRLNFRIEANREVEALCAVSDVRVHEPVPNAPSVLLVTSDTHRADHLGAADSEIDVLTPNIDSLASHGILFENCYTATNVTNPSHIALMTAVHPRDTMILNNYRPLVDNANTLAEQFREAGYATIAITSANHLGHEGSGLGQGFDRMYRPRASQTTAKHSVDVLEFYLREYEDTPVFVWLHVFDAHTPYAPPAPYDHLYYPEDSDPFDPEQPDPEIPDRINDQFYGGLLKDMEFPSAQYRGEITYLDDQLRRVFDIPRFAEGIIAFTADHGECIGHHGIFLDHASLYPASLHVPLILSYPDCPEGFRVESPVEQLNVARTLLELAGLESASFPGESLLSLIDEDGDKRGAPRFAVSAHGFSASLNHGKWHLILHLRDHEYLAGIGAPHVEGETELYDTDVDPSCTNDILEDHFELAKELRMQLVEWLGSANPRGLAGVQTTDTQTIRQLAALGYTIQSKDGPVRALWNIDCDTEWCRRFR